MKKILLSFLLLFGSLSFAHSDNCDEVVRVIRECANFGVKYGTAYCQKYTDMVYRSHLIVFDVRDESGKASLAKYVSLCTDMCRNYTRFYAIQDQMLEECKKSNSQRRHTR